MFIIIMEQIFIELFFNAARIIGSVFIVPVIGLFVVFKILGGLLFDKGR